jgi:hypothetical protein
VARVELVGTPAPGVTGKDIILALCGLFRDNQVREEAKARKLRLDRFGLSNPNRREVGEALRGPGCISCHHPGLGPTAQNWITARESRPVSG